MQFGYIYLSRARYYSVFPKILMIVLSRIYFVEKIIIIYYLFLIFIIIIIITFIIIFNYLFLAA